MRRPTIKDLAETAGLSVATVNRVLAGAESVRGATRQKVLQAAEQIGFYGLGAINARVVASRPRRRFGFLLLQPHRPFYHLEDLSPKNTAARIQALAAVCDSICITTAVHPLVIQTVEALQAQGMPVFAFITQLSATGQVHYVGLDNWKVGRTAAWAVDHMCKVPGKIGVLLGNPRYRNQEMNETGFRSYFREHATGFTLLEPLQTFESAAIAEEMTETLLRENADLAAIYVAGGGISGALNAIGNSKRAGDLVVIGYELMDVTRSALLDGTMTLAICHPLPQLAQRLIDGMCRATSAATAGGNYTSILPFELYTRESI
jgi:LacI family transcriptional regulator